MSEEKLEEEKVEVEPIDTKETPNEALPKKKSRFSLSKLIYGLLFVSVAALLIAVYFYFYPPTSTPDYDGSDSAVITPLPSELTDLNSVTLLVDKNHALLSSYVPSNLVSPYLNSTRDVIEISEAMADHLKDMMEAAKAEEISLYINDGYISYEEQENRYEDLVSLVGEKEAKKITFPAGYSEHQTGLAVDFTDDPSATSNSVDFGDTPSGQWLMQNAAKYGFILRYPEGKESITGYSYSPWHYRYVGIPIAGAIYGRGVDYTFEEYYGLNN